MADHPRDIAGMGGVFAILKGTPEEELEQIEQNIIGENASTVHKDDDDEFDLMLQKLGDGMDDDMSLLEEDEDLVIRNATEKKSAPVPASDSESDSESDSDSDSESDDHYTTLHGQSESEEISSLLEEIEQLKQILIDSKVPITGINFVDEESDPDLIRKVRDRLKIRYRKNKNYGYVQDGIMMSSWMLESAFDGDKNYFGFKPNLAGLSQKSAVKLRRIKYESSNAMESITKSNMPFWQVLALEFGPMLVLTAKQNAEEEKDINSEDYERQIQNNMNNIRQYE